MQRERSTIAKQKESIVSSPLAGKTIRGGGRPMAEQEDDQNPLDRIYIRSFDVATNQVIREQMKRLVQFIETSNQIVLRRFKACFIRDVSDSLYYVSAKELYFTRVSVGKNPDNDDERTLKHLQKMLQTIPAGSAEAVRMAIQHQQLVQKLRNKKNESTDPFEKTKVSKSASQPRLETIRSQERCQGDFCIYVQNVEEMRATLKSRKKKNSQIELDKSKIPRDNFTSSSSCTAYSVPTLLVKKVRDNVALIGDILQAHCIEKINEYDLKHPQAELKEILRGVDPKTKYGGSLYSTVQKLKRVNHENLYTASQVCKNCYTVYALMREYFMKIEQGGKGGQRVVQQDAKIERLANMTRVLERETANPKYNRKPMKRRIIKAASSGMLRTEGWVHSQELLKTQRTKQVFNVTRNPFERESKVLDIPKEVVKKQPQENPESTWQTLETTGNSQFESTERKERMKTKEQKLEGDVFGFASINHNQGLSQQLTQKILKNLERLRKEEEEEKQHQEREHLNPKHLSYTYNLLEQGIQSMKAQVSQSQSKEELKRKSLIGKELDVFERLSKMQVERWKAEKVPKNILKAQLERGAEDRSEKLSPFQRRKATSEDHMIRSTHKDLRSIKMQLGISSSYKPSLEISQMNSRSATCLGFTKGSPERIAAGGSLAERNKISSVTSQIVTEEENPRRTKSSLLVNFYKENNASKKLTHQALQDNIIVRMSAKLSDMPSGSDSERCFTDSTLEKHIRYNQMQKITETSRRSPSRKSQNESSIISEDQEEPSALMQEYQLNLFGTRHRTYSAVLARQEIQRDVGPSQFREVHNTVDNAIYHALSQHRREKQEESLAEIVQETRGMQKANTVRATGLREFNVIDFFSAVLKITQFELDQLLQVSAHNQTQGEKSRAEETQISSSLTLPLQQLKRTQDPSSASHLNSQGISHGALYQALQVTLSQSTEQAQMKLVFKTISTQKYAASLNLDFYAIRDCSVFLVDEFTSVLYMVVEGREESGEFDRDLSESGIRSSIKNSPASTFKPRDNTLSAQAPPKQNSFSAEIPLEVKTIIVLQDFYEDCLALKQFYQDIATDLAHQQIQFVLCNLPGQPFTQYDAASTTLNNVFLSHCLDLLLYFLQEKGDIEILTRPYALVGFGSGANLAFYHAYQVGQTLGMLKGVLSFNGFVRIDSIMQDSLQTCIQTYKSTPKELISQYADFYLRNLVLTTGTILRNQEEQCEDGKEGAFVTGGQTISSKIDLCKGVMSFLDMGECLKLLRIPLILVHSRKNCFIHNRQCDDMSKGVEEQDGDNRKINTNDIHNVLYSGVGRLQLFIDGGHCAMQENPEKVKQLIMNFIQAPLKQTGRSGISKHSTPKASLRNLKSKQQETGVTSKFKGLIKSAKMDLELRRKQQ